MVSNYLLSNITEQFNKLNTSGTIALAVVGVTASYFGASVGYYVFKRISNRQKILEKKRQNAESIKRLSQRVRADPLSVGV